MERQLELEVMRRRTVQFAEKEEGAENTDFLMMILLKMGLRHKVEGAKSEDEVEMDEVKAQHVTETKSMSLSSEKGDAQPMEDKE